MSTCADCNWRHEPEACPYNPLRARVAELTALRAADAARIATLEEALRAIASSCSGVRRCHAGLHQIARRALASQPKDKP